MKKKFQKENICLFRKIKFKILSFIQKIYLYYKPNRKLRTFITIYVFVFANRSYINIKNTERRNYHDGW